MGEASAHATRRGGGLPTQLPGMNATVPTRKRACAAGAQQASMVNESETGTPFVPTGETRHMAFNLTP